jgi:energy-coupling factor transporter transmembrane protein EcfT
MLSGFPLMAALFAIAGYEQTGTWPAGIRWGLYEAGIFTLRVKITVLFNVLLVRTTTVREFMGTFRWLRCPEQAILFLTTVIRFIPVSVVECKRIIDVQRCRGLRRRSLLTPQGLLPVLVPLLLAQVRRAHDLALCLEIRHFSWQAPVRLYKPGFTWADGLGWGAAAGLFVLGNL